MEEHTQLVVRSNTHGPVLAARKCHHGALGGEGGEGGTRCLKQTLKPPRLSDPSEVQLSAAATTPLGPLVPE